MVRVVVASLRAVKSNPAVAAGRRVILEIEVQGARQVKQRLPEVRTVFITGFPDDVKERELNNMLRFLPGYEVGARDSGGGGWAAVGHASARLPAGGWSNSVPPCSCLSDVAPAAVGCTTHGCCAGAAARWAPNRPAPGPCPAGLTNALPQRPGPGLCALLHRSSSAAGSGWCAGAARARQSTVGRAAAGAGACR